MEKNKEKLKIDILVSGLRLSKKHSALISSLVRDCFSILISKYRSGYEFKKRVYNLIKSSEQSINIFITTPGGIKRINKKFRNLDKATNVLTFSYVTDGQDLIQLNDGRILIGEIILNWEEVLLDSGKDKDELFESLLNLISHSMLHLFGYSHETKECYRLMEEKKIELMKNIKPQKSQYMEV
ncbi:MAG: rRNA maturation RNase YbeY [bacterium]|nr:rRNA maturation RNase YbeY [bacterium]